jgi:hypothetical protein
MQYYLYTILFIASCILSNYIGKKKKAKKLSIKKSIYAKTRERDIFGRFRKNDNVDWIPVIDNTN